jgi:hypothetical protein
MRELRFLRRTVLFSLALGTMGLNSPQSSPLSSPPKVDPRAEALLNAAVRRLQRAKSFSAKTRLVESGPTGEPYTGSGRVVSVVGAQPQRLRMDYLYGYQTNADSALNKYRWTVRVIGDGATTLETSPWDSIAKRRSQKFGLSKVYTMWLDAPIAPYYLRGDAFTIERRIWLPSRRNDVSLRELAMEEPVTLNGEQVAVVRWVTLYMQGGAPAGTVDTAIPPSQQEVLDTTRFYISTGRDTLMRRIVTITSNGSREELLVEEMQLDQPVRDTAFTVPVVSRSQWADGQSPKVGKRFPAFRLLSMGSAGDTTYETLQTILAGKKAALVWLWASH